MPTKFITIALYCPKCGSNPELVSLRVMSVESFKYLHHDCDIVCPYCGLTLGKMMFEGELDEYEKPSVLPF